MFGAASSTGRIDLYSYEQQSDSSLSSILTKTTSSITDDALCLSLDWNHDGSSVLSSDSKGGLSLHNLREDGSLYKLQTIKNSHTIFNSPSEVWTCAFSSTNNNTVYSGGDDGFLRAWDLRTNTKIADIGMREFEGVGVTCLSVHPNIPHLLAAGSYDEKIRFYDDRMLLAKKNTLARLNCNGGVWRIKWHPTQSNMLLVAAMHHGCIVANVDINRIHNSAPTKIVQDFTCHESMAYGADWFPKKDGTTVAASCSFYDCQAFLWNINA